MKKLLPEIERWFGARPKHFQVFAEVDSRVEGWFKAEMLVLLTQLVRKGLIVNFKREAKRISPKSGKRKQVDFRININGDDHYCELKSLCISQAAGTPRNLDFYFRDDNVGLIKDFKKLDKLNLTNKWALAFIYPSPATDSWKTIMQNLPKSLSHWTPVTVPHGTPELLFISLWQG